MDYRRRRLRLVYVQGAEEWTEANVGRGLTRDELGRVIRRYPEVGITSPLNGGLDLIAPL
jgi:hypothetical protein